MRARQADERFQQDGTSTALKRRGILAAAGAVVAGIVAKQTAVPVAAATVTLGAFNTEAATTTFYLPGPGTTAAVVGTADTGIGLQGTAYNNPGVYGNIPSASGASNTIAVQGVNQATGTGNVGVRGDCATGTGVYGTSTSGDGVYGTSASGNGVHGKTGTGLYGIVGESGSAAGSAGLLGIANGPNAVGFGTIAQGGATFAGYFNGTTVVNGVFAATGGKAAAVKDAAGDYRLMYCVEAPEAWFEDVGVSKLVSGSATVSIDPQFAQHIRTEDYHVFLTPEGDSKGLYVTNKTGSGFVVREQQGGTSNLTFSWRVMGKRADIAGERLAKFAMPPGLKLPGTPPPPAAPAPEPSPQPAPPPRPASSPAASTQSDALSTVQPMPVPRQG